MTAPLLDPNQPTTRVLVAMHEVDGDFAYLSFRDIAERSEVPVAEVRPIVRALAAAGHAVFGTGLVTEDGEFYGSGYSLTDAGRLIAREITERIEAAQWPFGKLPSLHDPEVAS